LLHHRVLDVCRLNALVLDEVLNLPERHNTVCVSALALLAGTRKGASKAVAALIRDSITTTVHSETEVDLLRIKAVEPEGNRVGVNLTDIGLTADDTSKSLDIFVPGTVEI
jgi:hypothetical protein